VVATTPSLRAAGGATAARAAVLTAAALLAACGPRATPPDPIDDAPPTHRRTVMLMNGFLEVQIEAPDAPAGPKPAVVLLLDDLRRPLLESGVVVVKSITHWELLHGLEKALPPPPPPSPDEKPVGQWLLASPSRAVVGQGYFTLLASNARGTMPRVLDVLDDDPDVDPHRLGVVGFSTNGFVALFAAAADVRLRVAVAIAACGDLRCFLRRSTLAMNGEPLALDPKYDAWLRELDLRRHPQRLVHAALLMVNGRHDVAVPFVCAERTIRALRRAYAAAHARDRFRFLVSDEGHGLGAPERDAVLAWLRRWLTAP
jgi:hypothetical protein